MNSESELTTNTTEIVPTVEERSFALAQRQAQALASSDLVPKEYKGNVANCLIAMNLAKRIGADPLMTMQSLDIIHGRPSFRAAFLIACVNMSGKFSPLRYRITGEGMKKTCVAYATEVESGEEIEGPPVSMQMAKDEGWSTKNGSKWITMPDLMLRYRAAAFFARTIAPELTMGLSTQEEMEDIRAASRPVMAEESRQSASDALAAAKDITPPADEGASANVDTSTGEMTDEPEIDPNTGQKIPDGVGVKFE